MAEFVVFKDNSAGSTNPKTSAVVTSFSNGRLKFECESGNNVHFGYYGSTGKTIAHRDHKILVAESDRLRYVGRNFGADAISAPKMCKYMLGIYDKRTNKVRLVDANLFHLRPSADDSDEDGSDVVEVKVKDEADKELTFAEKQARLILQFGTAKGKRAVKSRMRNKVDTKNLETVLASIATETENASALNEDVSNAGPTVIPPYNKDALKAEDVYAFDNIISPAEMSAVVSHASIFVDATAKQIAEWRESGKYPGYIVNHLSILPVQADIRQERACMLMYWYYMHRLLHAAKLRNIAGALKDSPAIVRRTLLDRFTIVTGQTLDRPVYMMPSRLKDLLRSYMLVLCLILEEFSLDFTALQRDLDVPLPQLEKCFQALGCKTVRQSSKDVTGASSKSFKATLVVPLTFPVYKARAGRR